MCPPIPIRVEQERDIASWFQAVSGDLGKAEVLRMFAHPVTCLGIRDKDDMVSPFPTSLFAVVPLDRFTSRILNGLQQSQGFPGTLSLVRQWFNDTANSEIHCSSRLCHLHHSLNTHSLFTSRDPVGLRKVVGYHSLNLYVMVVKDLLICPFRCLCVLKS